MRQQTATVEPQPAPPADPTPQVETPPAQPEQQTPPPAAEVPTEPAEVTETPDLIDASLTNSEEEILGTIHTAVNAARAATQSEDPKGIDYGKCLLSLFGEVVASLRDGIIAPLESRGTVHEVNERALYSSQQYKEAVEYALLYGNELEVEPNEEYPYGKLVPIGDAKVRSFFKQPLEETAENSGEMVPLKDPSISLSYSTSGTVQAARSSKPAEEGNGESDPNKLRLLDTMNRRETFEWNVLWLAWADAHKAEVEKVCDEHPNVFPTGKNGGSRIPSQAYGASGGGKVMDYLIEKGSPSVAGMRKGATLANLRNWGKKQTIPSNRDPSVRVPRFEKVINGSNTPYTE